MRVIRSGALAGDTLGASIFHHKLGLKQVQYAHNLPGREEYIHACMHDDEDMMMRMMMIDDDDDDDDAMMMAMMATTMATTMQ